MRRTALVLAVVLGGGCYPDGWDGDDWRWLPGVDKAWRAATGHEATTMPWGVKVWAGERTECLQAHEDAHQKQALTWRLDKSLAGFFKGELEREAQAVQDCCQWDRLAWDAGRCWDLMSR